MPRIFPLSSFWASPCARAFGAMRKDLSQLPRRSLRALTARLVVLCVTALASCIGSPRQAHAIWPFSSEEPAVGTPQWWKKHRNVDAVFDPGKGYRVPGVEGYFDGDGRSIQAPVARERIVAANESKDETGLIPELDPRVGYDKVKSAVGLGPNEQVAR